MSSLSDFLCDDEDLVQQADDDFASGNVCSNCGVKPATGSVCDDCSVESGNKLHASDCSLHNGPAYPTGLCDCGNLAYRKPHEQWRRDQFDLWFMAYAMGQKEAP